MLAAFDHRKMTHRMTQRTESLGHSDMLHVSNLRRLLRDPQSLRKASGLNQTEFWRLFGVTQSAGSRFESGRTLGVPIQILMVLEALGHVDRAQLLEAVRLVEEMGVCPIRRRP